MNQKTLNIIFAIILIILLFLIGFLFLSNKNKETQEENLVNSENILENENEIKQTENKTIQNQINTVENKTNENEVKQNITENSAFANTAGNYKFEYSKDWNVEPNGTTSEINGGKFAAVGIITPALADSTEKYLSYLSDKRTIISTNKVTINGLSASKVVISQDGLYYFIDHNNKVYFIHLTDISTADDLKKFNIILNSFQFIN
jgi:hypothetical protein